MEEDKKLSRYMLIFAVIIGIVVVTQIILIVSQDIQESVHLVGYSMGRSRSQLRYKTSQPFVSFHKVFFKILHR